MTRIWLSTILAITSLAACGRQAADSTPAANSAAQGGHTPTAPAPTDVLKLDPAMLRDLRMTTARVESRSGSTDVDMLGEIEVDQDTYAEVAPPIDAQVVRLLVSANSLVRAGEPLAELRSPELGRARAEFIAADARARLAAQTVERRRALAAERIVAVRELQEAESQLLEAQAGLQAAGTTLRALGVNPADALPDDPARFVLRSPVTGTVLERAAATGQMAQASTAMFRVANLSRVWVTVHAFERDAAQVRRGVPVRITLAAAPGREIVGEVDLVGRLVDPVSRTVAVRIELANVDGWLRPGMSATAHVLVQADGRTLLTVPAAAVQRVGEEWVVFSPEAAGQFRVRRIGRGRDLGGEVEVAGDLQGGDTVVVDGAFLLKAEAEKSAGGDEHEH